jgi:hypothetical protein
MGEQFAPGQRVRIKAQPELGLDEEEATVLGADGKPDHYVVEIDDIYQDDSDDGLRGVTADQMEAI